ncbi:hypothetical protein O181_058992 [Austropuccinia psidii MF-1]|uniref:Homeobox domain-containing protein n=1 Tax=Austropuccinia psidii MF-1 TaxID=1389203 RepID=A0A9Q3EFT4_9BASI|nr:hypothetical protein [Austropuccinia psidii MF-1]
MLPDAISEKFEKLEFDFLQSCRSNETHNLENINNDLNSLLIPLQQSLSTNSILETKVEAHLTTTHNMQVVAQTAVQSQALVDETLQRLADALSALSISSTPPSPSSLSSTGSSPEPSCSANSQSPLKHWCQEHMSYLFPTKSQLAELASQASMSDNQITLWFRNARTRSGWAKLYAHKTLVQKDQAKLKLLLEEFHSVKRLNNPTKARELIASVESYQMVDKILKWFETGPKTRKKQESSNVRPWIKNVISNTLTSFRQGAAGIMDSSKQLVSNLNCSAVSPDSSTSSSTPSLSCSTSYTQSTSPESSSPSSSSSSSSSFPSSLRSNSPISILSSASHASLPISSAQLLSSNVASFPSFPDLFNFSSPSLPLSPPHMPETIPGPLSATFIPQDRSCNVELPPSLSSHVAGDCLVEGQFDDAPEECS